MTLAAALLLTVLAAPAAAHVELVATDPEDGSSLEGPPSTVVIAFSGDLQTDTGTVQVADAAGTDVVSGPLVIEGPCVEVPLAGDAAPGDYTVTYALIAGDGHETTGEFSFTITAPEPTPTPTQTPEASPTEDDHAGHAPTPPATAPAPPSPQVTAPTDVAAAPAAASPAPEESSAVVPLVVAVAVVLALGAGVLYLLNRRSAS